MALPADERGRAGNERVVADRHVAQHDERAHDEHEADHAEQERPLAGERAHAVGRLHERDQAADEERDDGVEQRDEQARREHRAVPALRLANEVPVERDQPLGRRAHGRARGHGNVEVEEFHRNCRAARRLPQWKGPAIRRRQHDNRSARSRGGATFANASSRRRSTTLGRVANRAPPCRLGIGLHTTARRAAGARQACLLHLH